MTVVELDRDTLPQAAGARRDRTAALRSELLTDAALVSGAAAGQDWAWRALVTRYSGLVSSVSWSYRLGSTDAADVQQLVWMRLLENLGRIRQPELIAGWIASVTRHACIEIQRKAGREHPSSDEHAFGAESDEDIEADLLAAERRAALRRALSALPRRGRVLLETLLDHPGMSYEEVGLLLGMPVGSIGPTRQRCLERLRAAPELAGLGASA